MMSTTNPGTASVGRGLDALGPAAVGMCWGQSFTLPYKHIHQVPTTYGVLTRTEYTQTVKHYPVVCDGASEL